MPATTQRRGFMAHGLRLCASCAITGSIGGCERDQSVTREGYWLSGCARANGQYGLTMTANDSSGLRAPSPIGTLPVSVRAHALTIDPRSTNRVVGVARRPGQLAWVFTVPGFQLQAELHSPRGRHFHGHGQFSLDGRYLFTTENDFDAKRSVIGVWDAHTWQRLSEFPSFGIGAHALQWMPDGKTLVVCNGGILTHPAQPRKKLNLTTMRPNIAYIDAASGQLLDAYAPPDHQLSIRHLDIKKDGTVLVAMQMQRPGVKTMPLLAQHSGENNLKMASTADDFTWEQFNAYVGDVCASSDGRWAAASSPRGGVIAFWDLNQNQLTQIEAIPDVCGVAFDFKKNDLLTSAGTGTVSRYALKNEHWHKTQKQTFLGYQWDNHLTLLPALAA